VAEKHFTLPAVTIVTAGTRVQLTPGANPFANTIIVTASPANSGTVYVGDSTVTAANGQPLSPGESYVISTPSIRGTDEDFFISDVWLDASISGSTARVAYISRR